MLMKTITLIDIQKENVTPPARSGKFLHYRIDESLLIQPPPYTPPPTPRPLSILPPTCCFDLKA